VYLNRLHASDQDLQNVSQCLPSGSPTNQRIEELQQISDKLVLRLQIEQQPDRIKPSVLNIITNPARLAKKIFTIPTNLFGKVFQGNNQTSLSQKVSDQDPTQLIHVTGQILDTLGNTFDLITLIPKMIIGNSLDITLSPLWGTLPEKDREKIIADAIIEKALQMEEVKKQLAPQFDKCKAKNANNLAVCDDTIGEIRQIALSIAKEHTPTVMPMKNLNKNSVLVKISKVKFLSRIIEFNLKKLNFPSANTSSQEERVTIQATKQILKDYEICINKNKGDCDNHLSSSIFFRIGRETLSIMTDQNLKCLLPSPTFLELKKWALLSYDKCGVEYYFKNIDNKDLTADPTQMAKLCIMKSIQIASQKAIEATLEKKLNDHLNTLLTKNEIHHINQNHLSEYNRCLQEGGLNNTGLDIKISEEQFKTTLVNCSDKLTFAVSQSVFFHSIKNNKDVKAHVSSNDQDQFVQNVMKEGFLPCMNNFQNVFPENCQGYATSIATQMILGQNLKKSINHLNLPPVREKALIEGYHQCIDKHHKAILEKAQLDFTSYLVNPKCKRADSLTCINPSECPSPAKTQFDESVHVDCMGQTIIDQSFDLTGILIDTELKNNDHLKEYDFTLSPDYKRNLQLSTKECIRSLISCQQDYLKSYQIGTPVTCKKTIPHLIEFQKNMPLIQKICENKVFKDAFLHINQHILNTEIKKNIKNDQINDIMAKIQLASSLKGEEELQKFYQTSLRHEENKLQIRQDNLLQDILKQLTQELSTQNTKAEINAIIPSLTASVTLMVTEDTIDQVLESVYPTSHEEYAIAAQNQTLSNQAKARFFNQEQKNKIKLAVSRNDGSYTKEILLIKKQLTDYLSEEVIRHTISNIVPFDQFGTQAQDVILKAQKSFKTCMTDNHHNLNLCSNQETHKNALIILDLHLSQLTTKLSPQKKTTTHILNKVTTYFNYMLDSIKKVNPQKIIIAKQKTLSNVQVCLAKLNRKENTKIFSQMTNACVTLGIMDFYDQLSKNYIEKFKILHKKANEKDIQQRQTDCQEKIKQNLIGNNYAKYKSNQDDMIKRLSLSQIDLITSVQTQLTNCQQILEKDLSKIDLPFISD